MLSRRFAVLLAIFLVVEGVWELFSPVVFGIFSGNPLHGGIHILLGIAGFVAATKGTARGFLLGVGGLLLVVGILWFVPGASTLVVSLLNVNFAVACLNIALGVISLLIGFSAPRAVATSAP
jgi:hypothetical protein